MPSILFDLDGTLIESKIRLFQLFSLLIPNTCLDANKYWEKKQAGIGHEVLISSIQHTSSLSFSDLQSEWMELIESDEFLNFDKPFSFSTPLLKNLKSKNIELYLITARQFPEKVKKQLQTFGWDNYFTEVWVTQQKESKKDLLIRIGIPNDVIAMVGDTGYDILTANELGIYSVGVLTGFHSKETLLKYNPKEIIEKVEDIINTKAFQFINYE